MMDLTPKTAKLTTLKQGRRPFLRPGQTSLFCAPPPTGADTGFRVRGGREATASVTTFFFFFLLTTQKFTLILIYSTLHSSSALFFLSNFPGLWGAGSAPPLNPPLPPHFGCAAHQQTAPPYGRRPGQPPRSPPPSYGPALKW
jgi:hypothetical protein